MTIREKRAYIMNKRKRIHEAIGADKLQADITKAQTELERAMDAVTKAASVMYDIIVDATAIGGKVKEVVPSHVEQNISKLTDIVKNQMAGMLDGDSQSSLKALDELVGNMPSREFRQKSNEEEIEEISLKPNLANGPQSSVLNNNNNNSGGGDNLAEALLGKQNNLDMSHLREALGDAYDGIYDDGTDGMDELTMGLSDDGTNDYISPIEKMDFIEKGDHLVDDSLIADEPEDGVLSMDSINIPKSDGLVYDALEGGGDDNMMAEFANAPVTRDEFEDLNTHNM